MTSTSSVGQSPLSLLRALQQQYATNANASVATQTPWDSPSTPTTSSASGSTTSSANAPTSTNGVTGSAAPAINPNALFVFLSLQEQQSSTQGTSGSTPSASSGFSNYAQNLFNSIDTDGDGQISQSELQSAVTAAGGTTVQADSLFNKISGGSGSINESQLASALQQADGHHRRRHGADGGPDGAGGAGSGDPLAALLGGATADGATSQMTTNADGSTTTTLTYADGTTVTMSTPAASSTGTSSSGSGTTASNAGTSGPDGTNGVGGQNQQNMEQMLANLIQLQAAMAKPSQVTSLAA
jgi:hypothetical protein